ncbi:MAG: hypothetical protein OEV44_01520 [Spirochaetota bacterium]|nr:hypothetical protein [Spirochaetota bacterium]
MKIYFTNDYIGGLGKTISNYPNSYYEIILHDKPGLQIVYFFKSIFCKGVKMEIKEIFTGLNNKIQLNDVIFYQKK